ncbi:hypothetical protein ATN84_08545 [Paramesorhizobium deserti]|uniref:Uncharacterized protein n=1 Tax=Paramesorhizobium deserti TaxID=1494590 RepID=A0A135HW51_9HYPH|nr:hypothetical protein ATN84_08545 [Paramesorhizobium deserti]
MSNRSSTVGRSASVGAIEAAAAAVAGATGQAGQVGAMDPAGQVGGITGDTVPDIGVVTAAIGITAMDTGVTVMDGGILWRLSAPARSSAVPSPISRPGLRRATAARMSSGVPTGIAPIGPMITPISPITARAASVIRLIAECGSLHSLCKRRPSGAAFLLQERDRADSDV